MANEIKNETVGELFVRRMSDLELTISEVAEKLSFSSTNVISMVRSGRMRLPLNRAIVASRLLQVDPVYLLRLLALEMKEMSDDDRLLEVLAIATGQEVLTESELELVNLYRQNTHNRDVKLSENFKDEFSMIAMALEDVQKKVKTNIAAYAERKKKIRRGPEKGYVRKKKKIDIETGEVIKAEEETPEEALRKSIDDEASELKRLSELKNS